MRDIFLDFETYYDKTYSLRRMTTREYIMDQRFRATLLAVQEGLYGKPFVLHDDEIAAWIAAQPWHQIRATAHNARFDMSILAWRYGVVPRFMRCTLFVANCVIAHRIGSASLAAVSEALHLPVKDIGALEAMAGVDPLSLDRSSPLYQRYVSYAAGDVVNCAKVIEHIGWRVAQPHYVAMDEVLRAAVVGGLELDRTMLDQVERDAIHETEQAIQAAGVASRTDLRSNPRFAALLENLGVSPPRKISATTGKQAFAFSKKDVAFMKLLDHANPQVQKLVEARLLATSSISETRAATLKRIANQVPTVHPPIHIPLIYAGAHTGRMAGTDDLNFQNLPRASALRTALRAPPGYTVVSCDASQIEARILAWLAGCTSLVTAFANKEDVYSSFATDVFGVKVTKKTHPDERQQGKIGILSLGYATGADKLYQTLWLGGAKTVDLQFAQRMVSTYRTRYQEIPALWKRLDKMIAKMVNGQHDTLGPITFQQDGWYVTPEPGQPPFVVGYPVLQEQMNQETGYREYVFWRHRYKSWARLYGGALTENIVQHLAWLKIIDVLVSMRRHIEEQALDWRFVLQVHDEVVYIVPEDDAEECKKMIVEFMRAQPYWAACKSYPIPLDAEAGSGPTYGDAK